MKIKAERRWEKANSPYNKGLVRGAKGPKTGFAHQAYLLLRSFLKPRLTLEKNKHSSYIILMSVMANLPHKQGWVGIGKDTGRDSITEACTGLFPSP